MEIFLTSSFTKYSFSLLCNFLIITGTISFQVNLFTLEAHAIKSACQRKRLFQSKLYMNNIAQKYSEIAISDTIFYRIGGNNSGVSFFESRSETNYTITKNGKDKFTMKSKQKSKTLKKEKTKGNNSTQSKNRNWFSRVSRRIFPKSETPSNSTSTVEPNSDKKKESMKISIPFINSNKIPEQSDSMKETEKELSREEKQEKRRKEVLRKIKNNKVQAESRYRKQMSILQRNSNLAKAASLASDAKVKQNTTKIQTDRKPKESEVENQTNYIQTWGTVIGSAISNVWENNFKFTSSNNNAEEEWITVCPKTRLSPGEIVPIVAAGLDLLLVASTDGRRVYCIANACPHLGTPLDLGLLEKREINREDKNVSKIVLLSSDAKDSDSDSSSTCGDCIVCPLHRTAFALETGQVVGDWCPYPPVVGAMMGVAKAKSNLPTFELRIQGKNIEVRINSDLSARGASVSEEDAGRNWWKSI